jgi:type IV pilus assembly protein PilA
VNPVNPTWLRAVRISAFCIFLAIFVPMVLMYASLLTHYDPEDSSSSRLQWAFIPFLLWFPYFWVFWQSRDITDAGRVKKALAHAVSWGSFGALCVSGAAVAAWTEKDWPTAVMMPILALLQFVLLGSAITTYYSTAPRRGDLLILAARVVVIPLIAVPLAIIIPSSSFIAMEGHETSAADALRSINAAQAEYFRVRRNKTFASSLEELGPPPGAALIDEDLANGRRYNYTITLNPTPPDTSGCISKYTLTARPQSYGNSGRRSFFSNESGVIHYTAADRAPTVHDRVLSWFSIGS